MMFIGKAEPRRSDNINEAVFVGWDKSGSRTEALYRFYIVSAEYPVLTVGWERLTILRSSSPFTGMASVFPANISLVIRPPSS